MNAHAPSGSGAASIVVIEDEEDILEVLEYNLAREGFEVRGAPDGVAGLEAVRRHLPDLVLLDLMLPGIDGIELCRALRDDPATRAVPVIMLTAKGEEADVVRGLEAGADDYVTKPFSTRELVARVNAALRRGRLADVPARPADPNRIERGGVVVDAGRHRVLVDGADVRLTRTELQILLALVSDAGRVLTRDQLVSRAMGDDAWVTERTIDVHVRAIRKKLGGRAELLETVRGVGYRFSDGATA